MSLSREEVIQKRGDLSQFLIHLTRTGVLTLRKDVHPHLTQDSIINRTAFERLKNLLTFKKIKALSPFGYFQHKVPITYPNGYVHNKNSNVIRIWLKAACFTETPLDHIYIQTQPIEGRNLHFEPYGLAFKEDFIRKQGGSPVMYFESNNQPIKDALNSMMISQDAIKLKSIMPFYEAFGQRLYGKGKDVDFRWEREWRCTDDVAFSFSDVAFGICKDADNQFFSNFVGNAFPFIEPPSDPQQLLHVKSYLKSFSHLNDLK